MNDIILIIYFEQYNNVVKLIIKYKIQANKNNDVK